MSIRRIAVTSLLMALYLGSHAVPAGAVADRHTAKKLIPPGRYLCQMGSYKFRPCTVTTSGDGVRLVIPSGIGHFIPLTGELLPSDSANELTLLGRLTAPQKICPRCSGGKPGSQCPASVAQKAACDGQIVVARLKKRGQTFSGDATYFILRYSYGAGRQPLPLFKLGNKIRLTVKPARQR